MARPRVEHFVREERGKYIQPVLAAYIHASNYVNGNMKYKVFSVQGDEGIGDRIYEICVYGDETKWMETGEV
jgi:hypothetical protein